MLLILAHMIYIIDHNNIIGNLVFFVKCFGKTLILN
jgi:hypothetical protein